MSELAQLRADLLAEQAALDALAAGLTDEQWDLPTPSPGWTVADQIGHLTYFDGTAATAITDPELFAAGVRTLLESASQVDGDDYTLRDSRASSAEQRLHHWRANRQLLADASATLTDSSRIGWYGPSMGAKSFLTARLMEVWAHGCDVAEAIGATPEPTDRLRHIAQLGYITRGWSYAVRGETPPSGDVRLMLETSSGSTLVFGPESADDTITGDVADFCLVVTQRRHVDDTDLKTGELGHHWLLRAQAFAGGPTDVPRRSGS
jgi:uncharacterized protein (TIGR03084 family)